jgi:O-antigen/teichoic acid export membrane protein
MSEKRRIVVNTLANGTAQFTQLLSALVFMPLLIKGFGVNDYGLFLLASSIAAYATLLDLGVGASVVKLTAESLAQGDREGEGRVVSTALAFYTVVGLIGAFILIVLAFNSGVLFKVTPDGARLLRNLFIVAAIGQLWGWPATTATAVLQGHQRYTQTSSVAVLSVVLSIAVTLAVVVAHQGPLMLLVGQTAVSLTTAIILTVLARRALGKTRLSLKLVDRQGFRSIRGFAWAVFIMQICTVIVYQQTDRLVLGVFLGATAVALYEAAGKFQGLVSQLTSLTVSAVMPLASQLDAQGRKDTLRQLFLRGTKYSLMLVSPAVVVLIVVARPMLNAWLGAAFAAEAVAAQVLISHQLLTSGVSVGDSMIIGLGLLPKRVPYVVGVAALNLAISLALVRWLGIMGVVLGTVIPWFIDYPFHMRLILRGLDVPLSSWLKETVLPIYPLLLLPLAISWVLTSTPLAQSLLGIGVIGVTSVVAYWIAVYALTFRPHERADVRAALRLGWKRLRRETA